MHGFRPRHIDTSLWTVEQLESELEELQAEGERVWAEEKRAQEDAARRFEKRIEETIASGAGDRETAMRWIHQAEETGGDNDYLAYTLGLSYSYFRGALYA